MYSWVSRRTTWIGLFGLRSIRKTIRFQNSINRTWSAFSMKYARTPVLHTDLVFSELIECLKAFGPLPSMTGLAWAGVQFVAVIMSRLSMFLFPVRRKFFTVCKGSIAPFEVASFHALVFVLLFLQFGYVESRIGFPQRLCEDVDDFAPFEIFSASFSQHVFSIDVMFRISKVGKDAGCFPRIEERVCNERSYSRVSLDRVNVVQIVTNRILVEV
jgi:hypothetical protein